MNHPPSPSSTPPLSSTPVFFWWVLTFGTGLALVPTVWTDLDIWAAGLFLGPNGAQDIKDWWWVQWINLYVPAAFRTMVGIALVSWVAVSLNKRHRLRWRVALGLIVLGGAMGPGLLVNSGFKDNWQRARPYQVTEFGGTQKFTRAAVMTDQCNNNCSFVSGHVACGFFFASLMLVAPRRKYLWAAIGLGAGWTIGFARMADGAHWLSDALWACPITLLCSWVVWRGLLRLYGDQSSHQTTSQSA